MNRPRIVLTLACAALLVGDACAQDAPEAAPFVQTLTADDLREHGIFRLSDALDLLDGWQTASTDGYAATLSAGALGPLGSDVVVLVDGHPVDTNLLGTSNLNTLPLHLGEIERIEAIAVPTLVAGVFAPAGVLRITTRRPERGAHGAVGIGVANETSDPGPFRYTSDASPNIDRLGPNLWAMGSLAGASASLQATAYSDQHHATDERVHDRIRLLYESEFPARLMNRGGSVRGRLDGRLGTMEATASASSLDDFRRFEGLLSGGEVPLRFDVVQAGVGGDTAPGAPSGLTYRASYTRLATAYQPNRDAVDLGWREYRLRTHLTGRTRLGRVGIALGGGIDHTAAKAFGDLPSPLRTLGRFDATVSGALLGWHGSLMGALVVAEGRAGAKAAATASRPVLGGSVLTLHATYASRLPEERRDLASWNGSSFAFPRFAWTGNYSFTDDLISRAVSADVSLRGALSSTLRYALTTQLRSVSDKPGFGPRYSVSSPESLGVTVSSGRGGGAGTTLAGEGGLAWTQRPSLTHRLHYAYTHPLFDRDDWLQATSRFASTWDALARHSLIYALRLAPSDRFVLRLHARWTSATYWRAYRGIAERSGGRYDERIPARLLVDVSASKRLLGPHVHGFVGIHNLLDVEDRTHPIGPIDRLSLYLTVQAQL